MIMQLKIMEVVSTSNLVSLENKKKTTACNFQTMAMNSLVIPHEYIHIYKPMHTYGTYAYIQMSSYS